MEMSMTEIKIGDRMKIPAHTVFHPESGHSGKVVYISEDGKTVTVQCEKRHSGKTVAFNMAINSTK
jgi:hypothetical protein